MMKLRSAEELLPSDMKGRQQLCLLSFFSPLSSHGEGPGVRFL